MILNRWGDHVRPRFPELVLTASVLGFAFLIAELVSYHHDQEGIQIIGFSVSIVGLVLSLLALLTLSGLYGALEHREARAKNAARFVQRQNAQGATASTSIASGGADSDEGTVTPAAGGEIGGPPPGLKPGSQIPVLAPLSLSDLAGLTFLALLACRRPDEMTVHSGMTPSPFGRHEGA